MEGGLARSDRLHHLSMELQVEVFSVRQRSSPLLPFMTPVPLQNQYSCCSRSVVFNRPTNAKLKGTGKEPRANSMEEIGIAQLHQVIVYGNNSLLTAAM
jgi:hypothetical protein